MVELRARGQKRALHAVQGQGRCFSVLQGGGSTNVRALSAVPEVEKRVRVASWGNLFQRRCVQVAVQEEEVRLFRSKLAYSSEGPEPLQDPRAVNISARDAMPRARKGLATSSCLRGIGTCVQAVRAELQTRPLYSLRVPKTNASAASMHASEHGTEKEARAEQSVWAADSSFPCGRKPAQCFYAHGRRAFVHVSVLFFAAERSQQEVGHEGNAKGGSSSLARSPKLCEAEAGIKVLAQRANTERGKQAAKVLRGVHG